MALRALCTSFLVHAQFLIAQNPPRALVSRGPTGEFRVKLAVQECIAGQEGYELGGTSLELSQESWIWSPDVVLENARSCA